MVFVNGIYAEVVDGWTIWCFEHRIGVECRGPNHELVEIESDEKIHFEPLDEEGVGQGACVKTRSVPITVVEAAIRILRTSR
jgi:hypothetical protein